MRYRTLVLLACATVACATRPDMRAPPPRVVPLPGNALAGQSIPIWPVIDLTVDTALNWESVLTPRRQALDRVDSIIADVLMKQRITIRWVLPAEVRRAAEQAPGMLPVPDQMATTLLRTHDTTRVPEPLRAQLRQLTAVAAGGSYALVPASLAFVRDHGGRPQARLAVALVNVRLGEVSWSATLTGSGPDPWEAVNRAARQMTTEAP